MVKFGVAGYPLSYSHTPYKKDRFKIFQWLHELGLNAFEMQMTYGPRTKKENCKKMKELAAEYGITISIHAAYYIVFTSKDKVKIKQSHETLTKTYELADIMGADIIVLHPGSLYHEQPEVVIERFGNNIENFFHKMGQSHIGLFLETAGKKNQLGSVDEIIMLSKQITGCYPCIDFGHVHARTTGSLDTPDAINTLFKKLKETGLFNNNNRIHFHYTPVHYGKMGEITHKALEDLYPEQEQQLLDLFHIKKEDRLYHPRYSAIITNIIDVNSSCTIISETHNSQERGALAMQKLYKQTLKIMNKRNG